MLCADKEGASQKGVVKREIILYAAFMRFCFKVYTLKVQLLPKC